MGKASEPPNRGGINEREPSDPRSENTHDFLRDEAASLLGLSPHLRVAS